MESLGDKADLPTAICYIITRNNGFLLFGFLTAEWRKSKFKLLGDRMIKANLGGLYKWTCTIPNCLYIDLHCVGLSGLPLEIMEPFKDFFIVFFLPFSLAELSTCPPSSSGSSYLLVHSDTLLSTMPGCPTQAKALQPKLCHPSWWLWKWKLNRTVDAALAPNTGSHGHAWAHLLT